MGSKKKSLKKKKDSAKAANGALQDGGRNGDGSVGKAITDSRFALVHSDPRFAKLPKHKVKVAIDSRFDRMFTDKSFSSSAAQIDKRGKPKDKLSQKHALKHYYRLEEEEQQGEKPKIAAEENEDIETDDEKDEREELKKPAVNLHVLGVQSDLKGLSSEESEDDGEGECKDEASTDTTDSEEEDTYTMEEDTFVREENVPEIDKETHRLAVVNLDWGRVKAVDLFVLLSSFLPKGGQILSAAVYPSEFGLQRMEEEAVRGPVGLFDDENDENGIDDVDTDDEIDNEKLRAYELSRLRYYYAVVECDSIATADYLYKTCDGVEFERSSNKLDLRFIPDSMEFKHLPRDVAKEVPAAYEGLDFQTRALQLSKIDLTWDEDEPQRAKSLKRKFNADQLAELEVKEFLASDESGSDEDENDNTTAADRSEKNHKKKDMYRALLQSGTGSDEGEGDEDVGQDMEVTFNTGLEDLSKRILEKKDAKSETVWEQHLRKMKEKKKARRNKSKQSSEDESDDDDDDMNESAEVVDDFFVDEPSAKGSKEGKGKSSQKGKKNREADKEAEEKSRAELELLLADENGTETSVKGYNLKRKKGKGKKGNEILDEEKIPTIDYDDPRFSSLFTSPLFALDPTDPQFKRSAAYARQLAQKQQMGEDEEPHAKKHKKFARAQLVSDDAEEDKNEKKDKHELSSLVKSIKMKSKHVQLPSGGEVSRKAAKSRPNSKG